MTSQMIKDLSETHAYKGKSKEPPKNQMIDRFHCGLAIVDEAHMQQQYLFRLKSLLQYQNYQRSEAYLHGTVEKDVHNRESSAWKHQNLIQRATKIALEDLDNDGQNCQQGTLENFC